MFARFLITALLAAAAATPVIGQTAENSVVVTVDRAARASHALMKHRIAVAVEEVCGSYSTIESYQVPELDACRKEAWASVNRQLAALKDSGQIRLSSR
ncbi:UrcA family protein [Sphingomonas alba]|uniref:UrcA family protein n=1 Tax=Sphingomonas alba TaxID=2908208 RepID=A0ABT0RNL4_9SPHN|nr:UrcA family protein [Sphingomonas alba]MCL6684244.1 UrcA family protein [Sphingomonas alba]